MKTFRDRLINRINKQGEKIELRFKDRPISKERYERLMLWIAGAILCYLIFSLLCVIKVIGEWFGG